MRSRFSPALYNVPLAVLLAVVFAGHTTPAYAEVAVIVHPGNNTTLSAEEVQRLFLGKMKTFPGGGDAVPFNLKDGNAAREAFNADVIGKNESQIKAYWSQLVFTGKGTPPKEASDAADMKKQVASNPNMVGYIDAADVDASVKVVFKK